MNNSWKITIDLFCKIFKDIATERDNRNYCVIRILGIVGFIAYLILSFIELIRHCHEFNLIEVASGIALILGVLAGGVSAKQKDENNKPPG